MQNGGKAILMTPEIRARIDCLVRESGQLREQLVTMAPIDWMGLPEAEFDEQSKKVTGAFQRLAAIRLEIDTLEAEA